MLVATVSRDPDSPLEQRSRARYAARHTLWSESSLPRVRACGRVVTGAGDGSVSVRVSDHDGARVVGYAGLQHCGSYSACPVCNATIGARRQGEIERALRAWQDTGGAIALGTFTMRHNRGDSLRGLWDALAAAWTATTHGLGWDADALSWGCVSLVERVRTLRRKSGPVVVVDEVLKGRIRWVRVVEVTHGVNGWHVHVHCLLLLPGSTTAAGLAGLEERMWGRWSAELTSAGFSALRDVGADLRLLDQGDPSGALADYFVKGSYSDPRGAAVAGSFELARTDLKQAHQGHRTPFQILGDVVSLGDGDDLDLWHEWERVSKGRRSIGWSYGLRAELLVDEEELTDQEVVDQEDGGLTVAVIPRPVWYEVARARADWAVLAAYRRSDSAGHDLMRPYFALAESRPLSEEHEA